MFNQITLENCPGLATLLQDGEKIEELIKLSPEAILLRWVNYHLNRAGVSRYEIMIYIDINFTSNNYLIYFINYRQCHNFQNDITDSEIYTYLMKQIAPMDSDVDMSALMVIIIYHIII